MDPGPLHWFEPNTKITTPSISMAPSHAIQHPTILHLPNCSHTTLHQISPSPHSSPPIPKSHSPPLIPRIPPPVPHLHLPSTCLPIKIPIHTPRDRAPPAKSAHTYARTRPRPCISPPSTPPRPQTSPDARLTEPTSREIDVTSSSRPQEGNMHSSTHSRHRR